MISFRGDCQRGGWRGIWDPLSEGGRGSWTPLSAPSILCNEKNPRGVGGRPPPHHPWCLDTFPHMPGDRVHAEEVSPKNRECSTFTYAN